MPLVPSFTASAAGTPSQLNIVDTSTGSDVAIADRQISIIQSNGTPLVGTIDFPLSAGSSITIFPFTQDVAVNIIINWNNSSGSSIYNASQLYSNNQYGLLFNYQLTQKLASAPNIAYDINWYNNKKLLVLLIDSSINAINTGSDIAGSEQCITLYNNMIQNQQLYFY